MRPLRILMYSRYFPPQYSGAALQALSLANQLRARGHHIEFVTQRWPGPPGADRIDGFRVTRLEAGHGPKHRELRLWWNLARFLKKRRGDFDLLHSHGAYYTDSIVGPLGRWAGLKSVVKASLVDNDLHDLKQSLTGSIHGLMLRRVDACIAISSDLEREFRDGGVPAERVHCLPNGVDTERFSPASAEEKAAIRERLGLPTDRPVILYVGVFDCRKNIGWLVKEWAGAQGFGLGALLLAVGPQSRDDRDGGFKGELCRLAEAAPQILRIEGEAADTADYYRAADLFVMPSQSEGLPNAVLEAMATGLCCVAADVSGSRDLIQDGHTGYLFALNDAEALRLALNRGLGSDAQQLGTAARDHVTRGFNIRRIAERYESLYADLLGPAPAARAAQTIHRG